MSWCESIDFRRGGNLAVPDLTEYVAATSAGGSRAGLSRPSLVRHRASLFISTRMPPRNLLRVFIFVVKNKWTIWGRFHFYTNGPFWVQCQNGGFGAILLVIAVWCWPMLVRGDKRRASTSLRDMLRFYFAYLIFGGAFYLFLFAGDVATVFSTPPLVVNLVCCLFCLDWRN